MEVASIVRLVWGNVNTSKPGFCVSDSSAVYSSRALRAHSVLHTRDSSPQEKPVLRVHTLQMFGCWIKTPALTCPHSFHRHPLNPSLHPKVQERSGGKHRHLRQAPSQCTRIPNSLSVTRCHFKWVFISYFLFVSRGREDEVMPIVCRN